jgi:hypothetical protein
MCDEAYASFAHSATCPVTQLTPDLFLAELFHGPTLAFKDVAMQLLARLYDHILGRQGRVLTIVCATSGDTGGAAVEAFRGRSNVRIVVMYPEGGISEVQRRFMTTATDDNVACVSVQGSFDDCQAILKAMFADTGFARDVDLSAVNSINFARIAAQCVYFFTTAVAVGAPHRCLPLGPGDSPLVLDQALWVPAVVGNGLSQVKALIGGTAQHGDTEPTGRANHRHQLDQGMHRQVAMHLHQHAGLGARAGEVEEFLAQVRCGQRLAFQAQGLILVHAQRGHTPGRRRLG